MSKLFSLFFITTVLIIHLSSCKKGKNDPFLSFSSRKARISGEWIVTEESTSSIKYDSVPFYINFALQNKQMLSKTVIETSYNGSELTGTQIISNPYDTTKSVIKSNPYSVIYKFDKNGKFSRTINFEDTSKIIEEGTWVFLSKNKDLKLKNKEAISISVDKKINVTINKVESEILSTGYNGKILILDKLRKKEMIMIENISYSFIKNLTNSSVTKTILKSI